MKKNVFSYKNFVTIEDEDYVYIFRALEDGDYFDIRHGNVKVENQMYSSLRTYRERYNNKNVEQSRYTEDDEISLKQIYDHIKKNFYQGTNCISFSTNANVTLDYASGENEFAMIRVPKNNMKNIYFAGEYMLDELDKIINEQVSGIPNQNIVNIINELDSLDSEKEIVKKTLKYINRDLDDTSYLKARFINKKYFNLEQQLEYIRIVSKLTVLESHGYLKNIAQSNNSNLLATIGMAFSSSEVIHYNDSFAYPIEKVDRIIIDIFALIEQASTLNVDKQLLEELKNIIIKSSNMELDILNKKFGNIDVSDLPSLYTIYEYQKYDLADIFNMTKGAIDSDKFQTSLEYAYYFATCKKKTYEIGRLLKRIVNDDKYNNLIDNLVSNTIAVNSHIINRRNAEGLKICETVNLSANSGVLNNKLFNREEDNKIVSYLLSLNESEIDNIIATNASSVKDNLINNILKKESNTDINIYYAKHIIKKLNLKNIYRSDYVNRTFNQDDFANFMNNFNNVNFTKLYNSFKSYGLSDEEVSYYIVSLLINGNYKNYTVEEISNTENLSYLIGELIHVIKDKINPKNFDNLFNVVDDNNKVADTNMVLRDYQNNAVMRLNEIYKTKNYGGVILPTGAGKSFVALSVMLEHRNEKILYYAPRYEILNQFQEHICNHILGKDIISDYDYDMLINNSQSVDNYIKESDVELEVKKVFPYFEGCCYQGLKDDEEIDDNTDNIGLLILDEVHRTGGPKWNKCMKKVMAKNPDAKTLAITATPIRDVDQENMILALAKESGTYTDLELVERKHIASEMYLRDAMQQDIVVTPNIVSFDYTLDDSEEYTEIKKLYENETDEKKKKELEKTYHEMRDICEDSKKEGMSKIIKDAFTTNNKPLNGRYIVFIPHNNTNLSSEEYFKQEIEKVKEYFHEVDIDPEIDFLSSNRDDYLNRKAISNFKKDSNHLKLLLAIDMLNEGVHVKGIDGVVMLRKLSSDTKILYLQQIGRCIYSLDPENKLIPDEKRPIIFDVFNNYLEQNLDHEFNKRGVTSDYEKMLTIITWINYHKRLPDVNSDIISEARMAITLRNIKIKYEKYLGINFFSNNLNETEIFEIKKIIDLGYYIDLWNTYIPEREIPPGEPEIDKVRMFKLTANQKRFLDLYKEATKKVINTRGGSAAKRIVETLNILDLLSEYGFDINPETLNENVLLSDVLKTLSFDINKLIVESIEVPLDFELGKKYQYVRSEYYKGNKIFENYNVMDLRNMGIFCFDDMKNSSLNKDDFIVHGPAKHLRLNINTGTYYNTDGYDINGKDKMNFTRNDTFLNEFGFDREGYYYEEIDGNYVNTMSKLDPHNFDFEGFYHEIDRDGNDIKKGYINNYGFNQAGYYHKYNSETKTFVKTKHKVSPSGFDIDGYYHVKYFKYDSLQENNYILIEDERYYIDYPAKNGEYYNTNLKFNEYGFDQEGYYWDYDATGEKVKTNRKINNQGFDQEGYYYKLVDGKYVNTYSEINDNGFDIDGNFYEKNEDGTYKKSKSNVDHNGFDSKGLKKVSYTNELTVGRNTFKEQIFYAAFDKEGNTFKFKEQIFYAAFDKEGNAYNKVGRKFVKIEPETKFNSQGFNIDGKCLNKDGELVDYNKYGFNANGINIYTKKTYDKNGFDFVGRMIKGNTIGCYYNESGFDRDGIYWKVIERKKDKIIREKTNRRIDNRCFDATHTYWPINPKTGKRERKNGLYVNGFGFAYNKVYMELNKKTLKYEIVNKKYPFVNRRQFSADGFYWKGNFNNYLEKTTRKYDEQGFDMHKRYAKDFEGDPKDAPLYNPSGFDIDGFYWELTSNGTRVKTDRKYNDRGFDVNRAFVKYGKERYGYLKYVDEYGFDIDGKYLYIYSGEEINFNINYPGTYHKRDYDSRGFNYLHINKDTNELYDKNGFDIDGYYLMPDKDGKRYNTGKKYNTFGRDCNGDYIAPIDNIRYKNMSKEYDPYGFTIKNTANPFVKVEEKMFNYRGFDIFGYYCEPIDSGIKLPCNYSTNPEEIEYKTYYSKRMQTDRRYDDNGFDIDGYYWELRSDGKRYKTDSKYDADGYDLYGFDKKGINRDTNSKYDKYYFDANGINMFTGTNFDVMGFNQDRVNRQFGLFIDETYYDEKLNPHILYTTFEGYNQDGQFVGINNFSDSNYSNHNPLLAASCLATSNFIQVGNNILFNIKKGNFINYVISSLLPYDYIYKIVAYCMTVDKNYYKEFVDALVEVVNKVKITKKEITELKKIYSSLTKDEREALKQKEQYMKQNSDVGKLFKEMGKKR